jgi:hypothetical protein
VTELVEVVRSRQIEFIRKIAYRELQQAGQVPPELVGIFPPLLADVPAPPPPRPVVRVVLPAPPPAASSSGNDRPDVPTLARRMLAASDPAERKALNARLADAMAAGLDDLGWRNLFHKRGALVANRDLTLKPFLAAYEAARRSDSATRGKLFVSLHNRAIGHEGGPIEAFLGKGGRTS